MKPHLFRKINNAFLCKSKYRIIQLLRAINNAYFCRRYSIVLPFVFSSLTNYCQDTVNAKKYYDNSKQQIFLSTEELAVKLPSSLKPVLDYPMRDVSVCVGPDSLYYMTGTTGHPDMWGVTGDIKVWKSSDLVNWVSVVTKPRNRSTVWNVDREGSKWNKQIPIRDGAPFRPLWAPEIHYYNKTFWLTYCFPRLGNGILKSMSGNAEGPYTSALQNDGPLSIDIDGSLFVDNDGSVYAVAGEGNITTMKKDLSGPAGPPVLAKPANARHVGFEGAYLFRKDDTYYMAAAEFVNGDYHCFVASAHNVYGPYGNRYLAIPHGGHNSFFKDKKGIWWSTFFGNDKNAPFRDRPALLKIIFDEHGHIKPAL